MKIPEFTPKSETPIERSAWKNVYRPAIGLTAMLAAGVFGVGAIAAAADRQDPESTFNRTFAPVNECLSGTPFDPNNPDAPASIFIGEQDGYTGLFVLPKAPNYTEPPVLAFSVVDGVGLLAPPTFVQSDAVTGTYVSGLDGCPQLPPY